MAVTPRTILEARGVCCAKRAPSHPREWLADVSLTLEPGLASVGGAEDSGKSLLLRVLGLLEMPERGDVLVGGESMRLLSEEERAAMRSRKFGFVLASPFLLAGFSVVENIAMPLLKLSPVAVTEARQRTEALLDLLGISETARVAVEALPRLEEQTVALARALINRPRILLLDEVDQHLHGTDLETFIRLVRHVTAELELTAIFTHSTPAAAQGAARRILVEEGAVRSDVRTMPIEGPEQR